MKPQIQHSLAFLLTLTLTSADFVILEVIHTNRSNGSTIQFPTFDFPAKSPQATDGVDEALDLPEDFNELDLQSLNRLNGVSDISDFANMFNLTLPSEDPVDAHDSLSSRFGSYRIPIDLAKMAKCEPELVTVPLDLPAEPSTVYFPTCVRIKQCGGCCHGSLLTCRPTESIVSKFKVLKTVLGAETNDVGTPRRGSRLRNRRLRRTKKPRYIEIDLVEHASCRCGCRVTEDDCNLSIHNFVEGECACICKNVDEKAKCDAYGPSRRWNNDSCSCQCTKSTECSSGKFFSQDTCRCEFGSARSNLWI